MTRAAVSSSRARRLVAVMTERTSGPFLENAAKPAQGRHVVPRHGQQFLALVHQDQGLPARADGAPNHRLQHVGDAQVLDGVDVDVGGAAEVLVVLDARDEAVRESARVGAALQIPVQRQVRSFLAGLGPGLDFLEKARLPHAASPDDPQGIA